MINGLQLTASQLAPGGIALGCKRLGSVFIFEQPLRNQDGSKSLGGAVPIRSGRNHATKLNPSGGGGTQPRATFTQGDTAMDHPAKGGVSHD